MFVSKLSFLKLGLSQALHMDESILEIQHVGMMNEADRKNSSPEIRFLE